MDDDEMEPLPFVEGEEGDVASAAIQKRRRGKAIDWKFVKKFASIDEAKEEFTRGHLKSNAQFLGRKYTGKTSAIYINCQKVTCGCCKKWRLVSSTSTVEVVLEETSEDHSHHDLFLRGGGNGLSSEQIAITQEALTQNSRMKPLQILHHFRDKAERELALDPASVTIAPPDIVRLSSYLSYQRRKSSGAIAAVSEKRAAAKLAQKDFPLDQIKSIAKKSKLKHGEFCSNNSCMDPKSECSEEELLLWTKCPKEKCALQFCPKCAAENAQHALVCRH